MSENAHPSGTAIDYTREFDMASFRIRRKFCIRAALLDPRALARPLPISWQRTLSRLELARLRMQWRRCGSWVWWRALGRVMIEEVRDAWRQATS